MNFQGRKYSLKEYPHTMSANAKNSAYKARPVGGEICSPDIIMLKAIDWANDVYINWQ